MKFSSIRKMKFFKKRDKRQASAPTLDVGGQLQYLAYGSNSAHANFQGRTRSVPAPTGASARALSRFDDRILRRIFTFVCPHSQDQTYEKCEDSAFGDACMLCDARDLAHCVQVCRRWRQGAIRVLYHSIRIDSVHYCDREAFLADKRKRRSFFDRNGEPEDAAGARLKFLCQTLREDAVRLGPLVRFLKTPYMLRESHQADLARTIAVLPNLRYVDLPEGLFMDDPAYRTLKLEVQARCHDLRKMTYVHGAERSFEALSTGNIWTNLEVLELVRINLEPNMLRHIIAMLGNLRALKVTESTTGPHCFNDEILLYDEMLPEIPPLEELILTNVAGVTVDGLQDYLNRQETRRALKVLTLNSTGVKPWNLPDLLASTPYLQHLTIVEQVRSTLTAAVGHRNIPPLSSKSLRTLNYEITADSASSPYSGVTREYYNLLSGSLISGALPNLRTVYVRDASFPDALLGLPPPMPSFRESVFSQRPTSSGSSTFASTQSPNSLGSPLSTRNAPLPHQHSPGFSHHHHQQQLSPQNPFQDTHPHPNQPPLKRPPNQTPWAAGHNPRFSTNNPFAALLSPQQMQMLEVFTKGDDDIDWSSVKVDPALGGKTAALMPSRPVSSYGLGGSGEGAGAGARKSVFVSSGGGGGFLAVPPAEQNGGAGARRRGSTGTDHEEWPVFRAGGEKKRERMDLWR